MADKKEVVTSSSGENMHDVTFSKKALTASKRYLQHQDVLKAILDDSKQYTFTEVNQVLQRFLKGKVGN
ncbi:hypothetical protein [Sporosarcina sp. Te-1]|uniref:hypothetical protein n=1 Tax=Sporosarcina sp. Te-1 TaxID=2818390 RepID=UPI001A9F4FCF|nr:hypothetical protein [Sporosarcina sp. Te-1]QTD40645.1 hypothetical protein J3U78_18065 [Sporosarcina sp. Te-1]